MGAEFPLQPPIDSHVVVRRSKIRIVIDRDWILPEAARRLNQDHHIAGLQSGRDDFPVTIPAPVDEEFARRLAPRLGDRSDKVGRQLAQPAAIGLRRNADRLARELLRCQPLRILPACCNQRVNQRVARGGVGMLTLDGTERTGARESLREHPSHSLRHASPVAA